MQKLLSNDYDPTPSVAILSEQHFINELWKVCALCLYTIKPYSENTGGTRDLTLPQTSCMTVSKSLNLAVPQFFHLQDGDNDTSCSQRVCEDELINVSEVFADVSRCILLPLKLMEDFLLT